MIEQLMQRLQNGDLDGLAGTNLALEIPVSEALLTEVLNGRPDGGPIQDLSLEIPGGNRLVLELKAHAPVVGKLRRRLTLELIGEYSRNQPGYISFRIIDGLKTFDKPIINLLQNVVERRLPEGIDLNARIIVIDFPRLLNALGYGYLLGLVAGAKLETRKAQLVLLIHLKA